MRSFNHIFILLLIVTLSVSCKKENLLNELASTNIVNATVNVPAVKVNYLGNIDYWKNLNDKVNFGANKVYTLPANTLRMLSIVSNADTSISLFSRNVKFNPGDIYTLYLAGQSTAVDTILMKETNIPYRVDSTAGVRFINLSYNSTPVNVTLSTTSTVNEFSAVAYKGITDYKTYPALKTNGSYIFQVRDGVTNALLVSYTLTTPRFFNCTLALKGMVGGTGTNALGVMRINNY